jgi:hypothetical protein
MEAAEARESLAALVAREIAKVDALSRASDEPLPPNYGQTLLTLAKVLQTIYSTETPEGETLSTAPLAHGE